MPDREEPSLPAPLLLSQAVDLASLLTTIQHQSRQEGRQEGKQETRVDTLERDMQRVQDNLSGINAHLAQQDGTIAANHTEVVGHIERLGGQMLAALSLVSGEVATLKRQDEEDQPRRAWIDDGMASDVAELKRSAIWNDWVLTGLSGVFLTFIAVIIAHLNDLGLGWSLLVALGALLGFGGIAYLLIWLKGRRSRANT